MVCKKQEERREVRQRQGEQQSRQGVFGVLLDENKSLLLFYSSHMTAGM